jgi:transposase InsO family protein
MGKHHRLGFGTSIDVSSKPGDQIHADVRGPTQIEGFSGYRYFAVFKDDFSKYRTVFFLKQENEVVDKFKIFLAEAKNLGHVVRELLTDGGGEFGNKSLGSVTEQAGLYHRIIMPYTPEQNGSVERDNRL